MHSPMDKRRRLPSSGVGACPSAGDRKPGRIRRRPARGILLQISVALNTNLEPEGLLGPINGRCLRPMSALSYGSPGNRKHQHRHELMSRATVGDTWDRSSGLIEFSLERKDSANIRIGSIRAAYTVFYRNLKISPKCFTQRTTQQNILCSPG